MTKISDELIDAGVGLKERVVEIEITGRSPGLLMHNAASMLTAPESAGTGKLCAHGNPFNKPCKDCLEAAAYRTEDGELYIPSVAMHGTLITSSGNYKIGRRSSTPVVSGTLRIFPDEIRLGVKKYDIHATTVRIQRQRVVRFRPWLKAWKVRFFIIYDPTFGLDDASIKNILTNSGQAVGLLDFRPQHRGTFGRFTIEKFQAVH